MWRLQIKKKLDELEELINELFSKIQKNYIFSLFESMQNRLKQCIERNGDRTDY